MLSENIIEIGGALGFGALVLVAYFKLVAKNSTRLDNIVKQCHVSTERITDQFLKALETSQTTHAELMKFEREQHTKEIQALAEQLRELKDGVSELCAIIKDRARPV